MGKTVALILAGGLGKWRDILCHVRPKAALPFAGRFKVIDFTLSNCVYSRIKDLAMLADCHRSYTPKCFKQCRLDEFWQEIPYPVAALHSPESISGQKGVKK